MSLQPMLYVEPVVAWVATFTHAVTCVFISDAVSEYKIQHLLTPPTHSEEPSSTSYGDFCEEYS